MNTVQTSSELIQRLEQAEEGSRELNAEIHMRVVHPGNWVNKILLAEELPHYTTDLCEAISLIPPYMSYELMRSSENDEKGGIPFTLARLWDWRFAPGPENEWSSQGQRELPLQIVIAALRAREAGNG